MDRSSWKIVTITGLFTFITVIALGELFLWAAGR